MGSEVARASKGDPLHVGLSDSAGSGKESEALLNMAKVQAECCQVLAMELWTRDVA